MRGCNELRVDNSSAWNQKGKVSPSCILFCFTSFEGIIRSCPRCPYCCTSFRCVSFVLGRSAVSSLFLRCPICFHLSLLPSFLPCTLFSSRQRTFLDPHRILQHAWCFQEMSRSSPPSNKSKFNSVAFTLQAVSLRSNHRPSLNHKQLSCVQACFLLDVPRASVPVVDVMSMWSDRWTQFLVQRDLTRTGRE